MRISVDATDEEIILAAKLIENKVKFSHIARTNIDELVVFVNESSVEPFAKSSDPNIFTTCFTHRRENVPLFIGNCPVSVIAFGNDSYAAADSTEEGNTLKDYLRVLVHPELGKLETAFYKSVEVSPTKITITLESNEHGVTLAKILPLGIFGRAVEIVVPELVAQIGSHEHIVLGHSKEVNDLSHITYETRFFNNLAISLGYSGYGKTTWKRTKKGNVKFYYRNGTKTLKLPKQLKGLKIKVKHDNTLGAIVDSSTAEQDSQKNC